MNINFNNINFTGIKTVNKVQNKVALNPITGLTRDVFERTTPNNFTIEKQDKLNKAGFDSDSKQY